MTGLKSSQHLQDVKKNMVQGLKQELNRGVKRKTQEILQKKWPNESKGFDTYLVCKEKMPMRPIHSSLRSLR